MTGTLHFQLEIQDDAGSPLLILSSLPSDTHPRLRDVPDVDGAELDPVSGKVDIGGSVWTAIDADLGGGIRLVTGALVDEESKFQLLGKKAIGRYSENAGGAWLDFASGFVNAVRFPSALAVAFTIGDVQRAETTGLVWARATTTFDRYSSLMGGPVRGGFGALIRDTGPWRFQVAQVSSQIVTLKLIDGGLPKEMVDALGIGPRHVLDGYRIVAIHEALEAHINHHAQPYYVETAPVAGDARGSYPALEARVTIVSSGLGAAGTLLAPMTPVWKPLHPIHRKGTLVFDSLFSLRWDGATPAVNDTFDLYLFPTETSARNPLHIEGHPIDIVAQVLDEIGQPYSAASKSSTRTAIGERIVLLRPDRGYTPAEVKEILGEIAGFSLRPGALGVLEFFPHRVTDAASPATTITITDLRNADGVIFDHDEESVINLVTIEQLRFEHWTPEHGGEVPIDGLAALKESVSQPWSDEQIDREAVFRLPGQLYFAHVFAGQIIASGPSHLDVETKALALSEIFPRFATGTATSELALVRGVDVVLGSLVTLNVPHLPNSGTRGGPRIVQVVKRTPTPAGLNAVVMDAGFNVQNASVPTFTLAASAFDTRKYAVVTLTNAATLAAQGALVRLEVDTTSAGTPAGAGRLLATLDPATDSPFTTPAFDAGALVWIRARGEIDGERPSAWSAWQSVNLTDLQGVGGLARVGNLVTWIPNEADQFVEVLWRLAGEPVVADRRVFFFPPGSARANLDGHVPASTSITVTVRHAELPPFSGVSSPQSITYTTPAAVVLAAPIAPTVFSDAPWIPQASFSSGWYGFAATVPDASIPSAMVVEQAIETAVGAGTFGAFVEVARVMALAGEPTRWAGIAANDGLFRRLRAKVSRPGATDSAYTAALDVLPWGAVTKPAWQVPDRPLFIGQSIRVGTAVAPGAITKTMRFHAAQFLPASHTATYALNEQFLTGGSQNFFCGAILPEGATIISLTIMAKRPLAGDTCTIELHQADTPGALNLSVGIVTAGVLNAFQTATTGGLNHLVARGAVAYCWELQLSSGASFAWAEVEYTVPDYETSL